MPLQAKKLFQRDPLKKYDERIWNDWKVFLRLPKMGETDYYSNPGLKLNGLIVKW